MSKVLTTGGRDKNPWYREPWPWLLMIGPFIVVIAGFYTAWLAISSNDGLVTDDYYKKGLKVEQTIARSDRAKVLGVEARLHLTSEMMTVNLSGPSKDFVVPERLLVELSHPTRAGLDQSQVLSRSGNAYVASFRLPASGHWLVSVEDDAKTWRLLGNVVLPAAGDTVIGGTTVNSRHP